MIGYGGCGGSSTQWALRDPFTNDPENDDDVIQTLTTKYGMTRDSNRLVELPDFMNQFWGNRRLHKLIYTLRQKKLDYFVAMKSGHSIIWDLYKKKLIPYLDSLVENPIPDPKLNELESHIVSAQSQHLEKSLDLLMQQEEDEGDDTYMEGDEGDEGEAEGDEEDDELVIESEESGEGNTDRKGVLDIITYHIESKPSTDTML